MTPLDRTVTLARDLGVDRSRRALSEAIRVHRNAQRGHGEAQHALGAARRALLSAPPAEGARDGGDLRARMVNRARLKERLAEARGRVERARETETAAALARQQQAERWARAASARTQWQASLDRKRAESARLRDARDDEDVSEYRAVVDRYEQRRAR